MQVSFADSVDAITAAANDARLAGHDLSGFTRRTGSFGYRFAAVCRVCRHEVVVRHGPGGWEYAAVEPDCSRADR